MTSEENKKILHKGDRVYFLRNDGKKSYGTFIEYAPALFADGPDVAWVNFDDFESNRLYISISGCYPVNEFNFDLKELV